MVEELFDYIPNDLAGCMELLYMDGRYGKFTRDLVEEILENLERSKGQKC